jgi:hypothetical protein
VPAAGTLVRRLLLEAVMTTTTTTMTTNRLDRVIANQRRLMFANVATTLTIFASVGASIVAMF